MKKGGVFGASYSIAASQKDIYKTDVLQYLLTAAPSSSGLFLTLQIVWPEPSSENRIVDRRSADRQRMTSPTSVKSGGDTFYFDEVKYYDSSVY